MSNLETLIQDIKDNSVESSIKRYRRQSEPEPYYGVPMGRLKAMAKPHLKDNQLAVELWNTGILDAQILAVHMVDPKTIDAKTLWSWCDPEVSTMVLDKLVGSVISVRDDAETFEEKLLADEDPKRERIGWNLTTRRVVKGKLSDEELTELFQRIKETLPVAEEPLKWSVNHCLCEMGVYNDDWTDRCISFGEENGAYKEMKVAKGCTSAYAPEWIRVAKANREKRLKK